MVKTIIRAYDVIDKTTLSSDTSPNAICPHLDCEKRLLKACLGDIYQKMLSDAVSVEATHKNAEDYDEDKTYVAGDIVKFCGVCFERNSVEVNTEINNVDESPFCSDYWDRCERFSVECFNKIWDELCSYLAWGVYVEALPFLHASVSDGGVIFPDSDQRGGEGANDNQLYWFIGVAKKKCNTKLEDLKDEIKRLCDLGECPIFNDAPFLVGCDDVCEPEDGQYGVIW